MKIPSSIWTLLIGILLTLVSLWYGQNHNLLPAEASEEASLVDGLFNTMMTISTGIFLIVEGVLIYSVVRYRRRRDDDKDGPPIHGNVPLEILWTAIPAIIVIGISVYSFDVYNEMGGFNPHAIHQAPVSPQAMKMPGAAFAATLTTTPATAQSSLPQKEQDPATAAVRNADQIPQKQNAPGAGIVSPTIGPTIEKQSQPPALQVNVTGLQYAWIFTYPETGVTTGELHLPVGQQVRINITANDVIHAFWVPEFRLKQDAIPGRQTEITFTPNKEGTYALICAELCGPYHGAMRTQVVVEKPEAFAAWMQQQQVATTQTLNQAIAANPSSPPELTSTEFLAPYGRDMGITPETLHQIHN